MGGSSYFPFDEYLSCLDHGENDNPFCRICLVLPNLDNLNPLVGGLLVGSLWRKEEE